MKKRLINSTVAYPLIFSVILLDVTPRPVFANQPQHTLSGITPVVAPYKKEAESEKPADESSRTRQIETNSTTDFTMQRNTLTPPDDTADSGQQEIAFKPFKASAKLYPQGNQQISLKVSENFSAELTYNGNVYTGRYDHASGKVTIQSSLSAAEKRYLSNRIFELTIRKGEEPTIASFSEKTLYRINTQRSETLYQFDEMGDVQKYTSLYKGDSYKSSSENSYSYAELENGERKIASMISSSYYSSVQWTASYESSYQSQTFYQYEIIAGKALTQSTMTESSSRSVYNNEISIYNSRDKYFQSYDENGRQIANASVYESTSNQSGYQDTYTSGWYQIEDAGTFTRTSSNASIMGAGYLSGIGDLKSAIAFTDEMSLIQNVEYFSNASMSWDQRLYSVEHFKQKDPVTGEEMFVAKRVDFPWDSVNQKSMSAIVVGEVDTAGGEKNDIQFQNYHETTINGKTYNVSYGLNRSYDAANGAIYASKRPYYEFSQDGEYGLILNRWTETGNETIVWDILSEKTKVIEGVEYGWEIDAEGRFRVNKNTVDHKQIAIDKAIADLANTLDLSDEQRSRIRVVSAEQMTWNDGSVGFPVPGENYTMAPVAGWRVVLEFGMNTVAYNNGRPDPAKQSALTAMKHLRDENWIDLEKIKIESSRFEYSNADSDKAADVWQTPVHRVILSTGSGDQAEKWLYRVDYSTQEILSFQSTLEVLEKAIQEIQAKMNAFGIEAPVDSEKLSEAYKQIDEFAEVMREMLMNLKQELDNLGWGYIRYYEDEYYGYDYYGYEKPAPNYGIWAWPGEYPIKAKSLESEVIAFLNQTHADLVNADVRITSEDGISVVVPMADLIKGMREMINTAGDSTMTTMGSVDPYYYGGGMYISDPSELLPILKGLTIEMLPDYFSQPKNYAHSISVFQFFYYAMIAHVGPTDKDLQGILAKFLQPNIGRLVKADGQLDRAKFKQLLKTGRLYDEGAEKLSAELILKTEQEIEAAKGFIRDYEAKIAAIEKRLEENLEQFESDMEGDRSALINQRSILKELAESADISDASREEIKNFILKLSHYLDTDANSQGGELELLADVYRKALRSFAELETGFLKGMIEAEQKYIAALTDYRASVEAAQTIEELEKLSKYFPERTVLFRPAIAYEPPQDPRVVTKELISAAKILIAKVKEEIKNRKIENLIAEAERKIRAIHNGVDIAVPISEDSFEEMEVLMKSISVEVRSILVELQVAINVLQDPPAEDGGLILYKMWGYGPPKAVELENLANRLMNELYATIMTSNVVIETRSGENLLLPVKDMVEILTEELGKANVGIWSMEENYLVLKGLNKEIVGQFHPRGGHLYNVFQMMMYSLAYGPSQEDMRLIMMRFARTHDGLIMTDGKLDLAKFREVLVHGNLKDPGNRLIVNYSGGKAYIDWNPDEPGKLARTDIESGESVEFVEARDVMSCSYPANGPAMCAGIAFPGEGFEQVGSYKKYLPFGGYEDRIIFGRPAGWMPERVFPTDSEKEIFASLELMKFSDVSLSKEDKTHSYMFETKAPGVVEFRVTKSCAAPAGTACKPAVKTFTIRLEEGIATFAPVVIDVQGSSLEHVVPAPGSFTFSNIPADTEFVSVSEKAEPRQRTHKGYLTEMPEPSTLQRTAFNFAVTDSDDWQNMNFVMDGVIPEGIADVLRRFSGLRETVELTFSRGMNLEGRQLHVVEKIEGQSVEYWVDFFRKTDAYMQKAEKIHQEGAQLPVSADADGNGVLNQVDLDLLMAGDTRASEFIKALNGIAEAMEAMAAEDVTGHVKSNIAKIHNFISGLENSREKRASAIEEVRRAIEREEGRQNAINAARLALTESLGLNEKEAASIQVLSAEMQNWSDGCVGFYVPGQACTQAFVSGWRVVLEYGLNEFAYHHNRLDPAKMSAITAMKHFSEKLSVALSKIKIDSSFFESLEGDEGPYYYSGNIPPVHKVTLSTESGNQSMKGTYRVDYPTQEILSFEIERPALSLREALLNLHGQNSDIRIFQEVPQACTNGIPSSCWGEVTYFAAPSNAISPDGNPASDFKAGIYTARYSYVQSTGAPVVYTVSDAQMAESVTLAGTIKELSGPSILMRSAFVFSYRSNSGMLGGADAAAPALTVDGVQPEGIAEFLRPYSESGGTVKLTLSYSFELSGIHLFETVAINGESPEVLSAKMKIEKFAKQYAFDSLDLTGDGLVNDLDVRALDEGFQMILKHRDLLNAEQTGIFDLNQDGVVDANDQRLAREKIQGHIKQNDERQALIAYIQGVNERTVAYVEFLKEQMSMILGETIAVNEGELSALIAGAGLSEAEGERMINLHLYYRVVQAIADMIVNGHGDTEKLFEEFPEVFTMYGEIQEAFAAFMTSENLEIQFLEVVAVYETEGKTLEELREIAAMIQEAFGGDANGDGVVDIYDVEHVLNHSRSRVEGHTVRTLENFVRINAEFEALRDRGGERAALIAYIQGVNERAVAYVEFLKEQMSMILGETIAVNEGELSALIAGAGLSEAEGERMMNLHLYYRAVQAIAEMVVSGEGDVEKLFEEFPEVFTMYGEIQEAFAAFMASENLEIQFLEVVAVYETEGKTLEELREIAAMIQEAFGGDANGDGVVDIYDVEHVFNGIKSGIEMQTTRTLEDFSRINAEFEALRARGGERASLIAYIEGVNELSMDYAEKAQAEMQKILGVKLSMDADELSRLIADSPLSGEEGKRLMKLHIYYRAVQAVAEMFVSGAGDVEKLFEEFPDVFTMYGEIREEFMAFMNQENLEFPFLERVAAYETDGKTMEELREIVEMLKEAFGGDANQDGKIDLKDAEYTLAENLSGIREMTTAVVEDLHAINAEFEMLRDGQRERSSLIAYIKAVNERSIAYLEFLKEQMSKLLGGNNGEYIFSKEHLDANGDVDYIDEYVVDPAFWPLPEVVTSMEGMTYARRVFLDVATGMKEGSISADGAVVGVFRRDANDVIIAVDEYRADPAFMPLPMQMVGLMGLEFIQSVPKSNLQIAVSEEELSVLIAEADLSEAEGKRLMNLHLYYRAVQAIAQMVVNGDGDTEKLFEEFPEVFTMYGEIQADFAAFMESENLQIQFLEAIAVQETEGKTLEELREISAMIKEAFGGDANQDGKIDLSDVDHVINESKAVAKDTAERIALDLVRINQEFRNLKNGSPENKAPVIQPVQDISVVPANVDFPITGNPQVSFNVLASDPENDTVTLSMTFEPSAASSLFYNIPPAPAFDAAAGTFRWQPSARDVGTYKVTFHAVDAHGNKSSTTMNLEVKSPAICNSTSATCKNLKAWALEGTAAGSNARYEVVDENGTVRVLNGVTYVNRDGRHAWKGDNSLTQQVRVVTGWAAPYSPVTGVVAAISNSSTSGSTPMSDNIGSFLSSQWGAQTNVNLARNNNLHFSPEHRSHDAGTNYGDAHLGQTALGHIVSQGSSGSEGSMPQYAQQAVAAMNSEVQRALAENGMMTRALQMLFRKNINGNTEEDYFTGKAHPRAFVASSINGASLVQDAHDLQFGELPADIGFEIVSHNLNEDTVSMPNTDKETQIYNTREAAAFVHRGLSYYSEFVVRPNVNHYDGAETDVEFVVTATRGEAEITKQDDGNYLVRIPYQNRQPVLPGSDLDSNRVDIMITTGSGAPPAFISVNTAANEKRIYDEETKKIQRIEYSKSYWQHSVVGSNVSYDSADFHYDGETLSGFTLNRGAEAFNFTADGKLIEAVDVSGRVIQARNIKFEVAVSGTFKNLMVAVIQPEVFHFEYTANGKRRIKHIDTLSDGKVVRRDRYEYNNSDEVSRVQILSVDLNGAEILSAILIPQENGLARISTPDEAFSILVEFSGFMPVLRSNTNFLPYLMQLSLIGQISARENNMDPDSLILSEIYFSDSPASEPYQGYLGNLQARFMNADKTLNLWGYSWTKRSFPQDLFPDYPEQTGFQIAYSLNWPYSFYDYSESGAFMGRHEQDHEDRVRALKIVEARFRADYPDIENPVFKITRSLSQEGGWEGDLSAGKPSPDRKIAGGYEISVEDESGNVKMTYEIQKRYSASSSCDNAAGCYDGNGTYNFGSGILWRLFEDSEMPERFEEYKSDASLTARRDLILDANGDIQGIDSSNADGVLVSTITFSSPVEDMSGAGKAIVKIGEATHELTFAGIYDLLDQLNLLENLKA